MRAIGVVAMAVENQAVLSQRETALLGNGTLAALDLLIAKLLDPPALQAQDMVVVSTVVDFKY